MSGEWLKSEKRAFWLQFRKRWEVQLWYKSLPSIFIYFVHTRNQWFIVYTDSNYYNVRLFYISAYAA